MADGMLSLSWNNHKATFCHILSTLRDKERYTDVTVACEGRFYPVHKLVLSTCSEYFEKIFENTPCKHPVIVLKDVNRGDLEALFCYMYEGAVSVAQSNLGRLIKAAEVLRIKGLAVPDEPPISESGIKRMGHSHHASDDRSSPHPKRRRREDGYKTRGAAQSSPSPPPSPKASPARSEGEVHQSSRSKSENIWANDRQVDEHGVDHQLDDRPPDQTSRSSPAPPQVEVTVDESLVKEEMIDQGEDGQDEVLDSGMEYGSVGSDSRLDGSGGAGVEDDHGGHMVPNKYEHKVNPAQTQALPEAVVEALAGPSGMQGWLGGCEMPPGFSGLEGYGGEGNQDLHGSQVPPGSQPQAHQLVEREAKYLWTECRRGEEGQGLTCNSKVHQCSHCAYQTPDSYKMKRHTLKHTGERPFSCPYCSYSTTRKEFLNEHINTHTGEKPFSCPHCPYSSSHKNILRRHIRRHTNEKIHRCNFCSFQSHSEADLSSHLLIHLAKDQKV